LLSIGRLSITHDRAGAVARIAGRRFGESISITPGLEDSAAHRIGILLKILND
jgi:hypothetical protein